MTDAILTYPADFYHREYSRKTGIMKEYKANMLLYLKKRFPEQAEHILKEKLDVIVAENYKSSRLNYLSLPSSMNVDIKSGDLLEVTNELNRDLLSPYGATYCSVHTRKALFSDFIDDNQQARKIVKKKMVIAEADGDTEAYRRNNLDQMNIKININALSGVMLSNVTFRSGINYNAITATSRFSVMTAYAVVEMAMASNYYFHSEDRAINWIINLLRVYPGDDVVSKCIGRYKINIPSTETVLTAYSDQVKLYSSLCQCQELKKLIENLSPLENAFIYYAVNMKRIFQENEYFRAYFDKLLNIESIPMVEGEVPDIRSLPDGIVMNFVVVCLAKEIGKLKMEVIVKNHPELARKIYSTYLSLERGLKFLENLFETFVMLPIMPSDIPMHKNMIRNTVLLSDTDSIMFTNMNWIKWYCGNIHITDHSTRMNVATITLMSKFLEHVLAYMSASMNVDLINIKLISIKNEFMYDLFLRTPMSKHYSGYVKYREGVLQDPYKFDLKGKNFKGSNLCKETTSYVIWLTKYIFDSFLKTYEIDPEDLITKTIIFEQRIRHSINAGEVTFLQQQPIKLKKDYGTPKSSNYLFFELWQAVFAEKYGDLYLPQKTKELPIMEVSIKDISNLVHIKKLNPSIYDKFILFIKQYPKREFSRVLIPMDIEIPEELRAIADFRKVCSANCLSLKIILRSFNIVNYPDKKGVVLFSDTYPQLLKEITDEDRKRVIDEADMSTDDLLEDDADEDWIDERYDDEESDI